MGPDERISELELGRDKMADGLAEPESAVEGGRFS